MFTKEESREHIKLLAESFGEKIDFIKNSGQYKEAQIEDEFIKPLFKYLNWNISNEGITNTADREFIVQAKGRNGKEPDYLLQLDQKPKFYVEAKHSKYDLQKRTDYIWQAYSYSYSTQSLSSSKKVDFALLTDFEEFRFFDCTFPVKDNSNLNNYCVIDWTYKDYINKFDDLWDYFEKENVRRNSLTGATGKPTLYLNEKKIKANRIPPDKAFLNDLDNEESGWRITLAKDIKKYQPEFTSEFITQSVQLILDRFIFIKVLSDREIEEEIIKQILDRIQKEKSVSGEDSLAHSVFEECKDIFHDLDKTYNGSIFSERAELDGVKVGNKTLLAILKDFLPENSRYNFKVIPVEILGTIYEQFLGKVVTTTDKRAKIEYKAEVRKAGGVYYTPDYIVNYIVEKTVGEKLKECKTIEDLLEIKICDPACGSGSFLIAAYDALIHWTIDYYKNKKLTREEQKVVYTDSNGDIRLTSKIKRDILRSCIYGVDIDAQAVEVTKMSLSLKALENTTHYEVHNEVTLFHVCVLPPLEGNIKCGNSLVGTRNGNIFEFVQGLNKEDLLILKPFDWNIEFKNIMQNGGFDCIIGNPPYLNIDDTWGKNDFRLKAIKENYTEVYNDKTDILFYFLAKSIKLSKSKISFIVSRAFLEAYKADKLRNYISTNAKIEEIIDFRNYYIFKGVGITTCIVTLKKDSPPSNIKVQKLLNNDLLVEDLSKTLQNQEQFENFSFEQKLLSAGSWSLENPISLNLNQKIDSKGQSIGEILSIGKGMETGRNDVFGEKILKDIKKLKLKKKQYYKRATNSDIQKYFIKDRGEYLLYVEEFDKFKDLPETLQEYLKENSKELKDRAAFKRGDCEWWKFTWPLHKEWYSRKKILCPYLATFNRFMIDEGNEFIGLTDTIALFENNQSEDLKYILGLLNSKLLTYRFKTIGKLKSGGILEYFWNSVSKLVIKRINFQDKKEKELHDKIVKYVESIISLSNESQQEVSSNIKEQLKRQIDSTDREIDSLVYQLYDLTPEEIKIVEGENV